MKKKLVVLTGAGMSAESGIATFRDFGRFMGTIPGRTSGHTRRI